MQSESIGLLTLLPHHGPFIIHANEKQADHSVVIGFPQFVDLIYSAWDDSVEGVRTSAQGSILRSNIQEEKLLGGPEANFFLISISTLQLLLLLLLLLLLAFIRSKMS